MIMAGGTGGHVYPALAVAESLRRRGVDVVWMGTRRGLESGVVPSAGIELSLVDIKGLRGSGLVRKLQMPFLLLHAMWQSFRLLRQKRPDAVLGMGGFVAGPGGLVAWMMRLPLLVHEANAVFGFTNRLLSRIATRVMTGFRHTEPSIPGALHVGNPLRREFLQQPDDSQKKDPSVFHLLVVGGSQGAVSFNEIVPAAVARLSAGNISVHHQCGRGRQHETRDRYAGFQGNVRVSEFIDDMAGAYRRADLVICRAGAMTVAEVQAIGRACIFIPYPYAAGDHQARNAEQVVSTGAALMLRHEDFTPDTLAELLRGLIRNPSRVREMDDEMAHLAKRDATDRVAEICLEVLHA